MTAEFILYSGSCGSNLPWIITNHWDLIFNPTQQSADLETQSFQQLIKKPLLKNNVQSIRFNGNIHISSENNDALYSAFSDYKQLKSADLSALDFSCIIRLNNLFSNCYQLETIQFPSFCFGQNVTSIDSMCFNCINLHTLDLSAFCPDQLTYLCTAFKNCIKLTTLNLSRLTLDPTLDLYPDYCFENCTSLQNLYFPALQALSDTSDIQFNIFNNCSSLQSIHCPAMIRYDHLMAYHLPDAVVQNYLQQFSGDALLYYIQNYAINPADRAELMQILHSRSTY